MVRKPLDLDRAQPIDWNCERWSAQEALVTWRSILQQLSAKTSAKLAPGVLLLLHDSQGIAAARKVLPECAIGELERAEL